MFLQLPIFIGLYRGLSVDIALRDQPLIPGLKWCGNLAGPDQLWYWKDAIPFSFLTHETGWLGPYLNILPIVTIILFLMQQKLFTPPPTDDQQKLMHKMMTFMMIFMGVLFFKVSAGLCIYFITSSLWGNHRTQIASQTGLKRYRRNCSRKRFGNFSKNKSHPKLFFDKVTKIRNVVNGKKRDREKRKRK